MRDSDFFDNFSYIDFHTSIFSPERTYCVCGPSIKGIGNDDFYETKSSFGVQVVQVFQIDKLKILLLTLLLVMG